MNALLLAASLLTAAQSSGPKTPVRPPFAISTTFPRVVPLAGSLSRPPAAAAPAPVFTRAVMPRVPAPLPSAEYGVVPHLDSGGVFRLPRRPASSDEVSAAGAAEQARQAGAEPARGGESDAAEAGAAFDGSASRGEYGAVPQLDAGGVFRRPPAGPPAGRSELPSFLSVPDPADRGWIADVVNVARGTKTGARILAGVEKLAAEQKRPLTVVVAPLRTNNGEYVYDWDVVRMNSAYRKLDAFSAAPIFMHELQHVLQKVEGYPVDALELELEAFLVSLRMFAELGMTPDKGSFERGAARALARSAEAFVKYVGKSYSNNRALGDGGLRAYRAAVEKDLARHRRNAERLDVKIARERANVEVMRASGQPESNIAAYEQEVIGALSRKLDDALAGIAWAERDLKLLNSPEDAARYRRYAAKVRRMVRAAAAKKK